MKKLCFVILCTMLILGLVSCGGNETEKPNDTSVVKYVMTLNEIDGEFAFGENKTYTYSIYTSSMVTEDDFIIEEINSETVNIKYSFVYSGKYTEEKGGYRLYADSVAVSASLSEGADKEAVIKYFSEKNPDKADAYRSLFEGTQQSAADYDIISVWAELFCTFNQSEDRLIAKNVTEKNALGKITKVTAYNQLGEVSNTSLYNYLGDGTLGTIDEYNSENVKYASASYDSNGNKIKTVDYTSDGEVQSANAYEYDANGNIIKWTVYDRDESVNKVYSYIYNKQGNLQVKFEADGEGNHIAKEEYTYTAGGGEVKYYTYDENDTELLTSSIKFSYDTYGNWISFIESDADGNVIETGSRAYVYSENGLTEKYTDYNSDGVKTSETHYSENGGKRYVNYYNEEGIKTSMIHYDDDGHIDFELEYHANGNFAKLTNYNVRGEKVALTTYTEEGVREKMIIFNSDGSEKSVTEYDEKGNIKV